MEEIDSSLQDFHYTFECGTRLEKLSFRTLKPNSPEEEFDEIRKIWGDAEVIKKYWGFPEATAVAKEHVLNVQQLFRERTSLAKGNADGTKAMWWKLYFTPDMGHSNPEAEFIGFIGAILLKSKMIEPHLALRPKYQNMRLGRKAILSLVAKLLTHRAWMMKCVTGVFIPIQSKNQHSIALKDKLGLNRILEQPNPRRKDGAWLDDFECFSDKVTRILQMKHFICSSETFLVSLFDSFTQQAVKKRDHLLLDQAITAGLLLSDVETSLQNFEFVFDEGSKKERLVFRTLKRPGSHSELDEILSVFRDAETMEYYGFEAAVETVEDARIKREQMRQELSFDGMHRTIRWRISCSSDSGDDETSERFIGFAALLDVGRAIEPSICLHANYQQKGFGTKILMCLMMKLLKYKSWLKETFDEILITVNADDMRSLALKDKLLPGLDTEELCGESANGLWTHKRTENPSGNEIVVNERKFRCPCIPVIQKALMLMQSGTFKGNCFPYYDNHEDKHCTMSPVESCPNVGVKPVSLYPEDVQSIIKQLLSRDATPIDEMIQFVHRFQVQMPMQVCRAAWHSGSFFLFFFAEGHRIVAFEVLECHSDSRYIRQDFLAFENTDTHTQRLSVRMPSEYAGTLKAYLAEFDMKVFEKQGAARSVESGLRSLWTSTEFEYSKNKRRRCARDYEHLLVLREAKLARFDFFA